MERNLPELLYGSQATPRESLQYGTIGVLVAVAVGAIFAVTESVTLSLSLLAVGGVFVLGSLLLIGGGAGGMRGFARWDAVSAVGFIAFGLAHLGAAFLVSGVVGPLVFGLLGVLHVGKGVWLVSGTAASQDDSVLAS